LEAQIIDFVDEIAYSVHDIDDGVEAHIISAEALVAELPVFARLYEREGERHPTADGRQRFNETIRVLLDTLVTDLIDTSTKRIHDAGVTTIDDVRRHPDRLVAHTREAQEDLGSIADFLMRELYRSPRVDNEMRNARRIIGTLVAAYSADPSLLPNRHQARIPTFGEVTVIADYVAGMTDRFALREHARLDGGVGDRTI
jgi:dGTPase